MTSTEEIAHDVLDRMHLLCSECGEFAGNNTLCAECEARLHPRCGECNMLFSCSRYEESEKKDGELCESCREREEARAEWNFLKQRRRASCR